MAVHWVSYAFGRSAATEWPYPIKIARTNAKLITCFIFLLQTLISPSKDQASRHELKSLSMPNMGSIFFDVTKKLLLLRRSVVKKATFFINFYDIPLKSGIIVSTFCRVLWGSYRIL